MKENENSALHRISKIISDVFNPLTALVLFYLYYSLRHHSAADTAFDFLPILFILILPITGWLIYNVKKGNYSNMDVSDRHQRKSLYYFIIAMLAVFLAYQYIFQKDVNYIFLFMMVLLIAMNISNYFIKSSMHTAFNVFAAALFFSVKPLFGLLWMIIAIIVGISRVILKRHTVAEVLSGAGIAAAVSCAYLYTVINNYLE